MTHTRDKFIGEAFNHLVIESQGSQPVDSKRDL